MRIKHRTGIVDHQVSRSVENRGVMPAEKGQSARIQVRVKLDSFARANVAMVALTTIKGAGAARRLVAKHQRQAGPVTILHRFEDQTRLWNGGIATHRSQLAAN